MNGFTEFFKVDVVNWFVAHGFRAAMILLVSLILTYIDRPIIDRVVRRFVQKGESTATAELKRENTLIRIFTGTVNFAIWIIAIIMILAEIGVNIGPILAGAGIIGVALGFGAQYIVRDILTGFFIVMENQFRVGDNICINDTCGTVESISLRTTVLRDVEGTVHSIPNGEIKISSNRTRDYAVVNLKLHVAYESDIDAVAEVVETVSETFTDDEKWSSKLLELPYFVRVEDFTDSAVEILVRVKVLPKYQWAVAGELRKRIKVAFEENSISMPYPQQVVHYINK